MQPLFLLVFLSCTSLLKVEAAAVNGERVVVTFNSYDACDQHVDEACATVVKCYGRRLVLRVQQDCFSSLRRAELPNNNNSSVASSSIESWVQQQYVPEALAMVEADGIVEASSSVSDASKEERLWHLDLLGAYEAWDRSGSYGEQATVAVIDSGIVQTSLDAFLPDRIAGGYDFMSDGQRSGDGDGRDPNYFDPGDGSVEICGSAEKSSWHGTKVASVLAANFSNYLPTDISNSSEAVYYHYLGVAPAAYILPVRVLGLCKQGYASDVADGIVWAAGGKINGLPLNEEPADVILMSLAGRGLCPSYLQTAVDLAVSRGATLYAAAGNDQSARASDFFPANCRGVISVGARNWMGGVADYSAQDAKLYMPGGEVQRMMPCLDAGLLVSEQCMGTSFAAAVAAGMQAVTGEKLFSGEDDYEASSNSSLYYESETNQSAAMVQAAYYTVTTNLVVWYRFNGGATAMLADSSGNGYTLTNGGSAQFSSTIFETGGGSLYLSGANAQTNVLMPSAVNPSTIQGSVGISIAAWFRMSTATGAWGRIFDFSTTSCSAIFLACRKDSFGSGLHFRLVNTVYETTTTYVDDTWHHMVWIIDASGAWSIYMDNVQLGIGTIVQKVPTYTDAQWAIKAIGKSCFPTDGYYVGYIDDFRIYRGELTAAQVSGIFSNAAYFLYEDATQYSRWFADGTHNDLSGKIAWTSTGSSMVWTANSGPFPNTASVSNPFYTYAPAGGTMPSPNPIDWRDRSITVSWWLKRACFDPLLPPAHACTSDTTVRGIWDWRQTTTTACATTQYNLAYYFYADQAAFGRPCSTFFYKNDPNGAWNNRWMHWAMTVNNKGSATADDFAIYENGVMFHSGTYNEAPALGLWNEVKELYFGSSTPGIGSLYDARFWYTKALDATNIKRQMCFNGYYWGVDATYGGKCTACPAGKFSDITGAADSTECQSCPAGYTSTAGSAQCTVAPTPAPTPAPTTPPPTAAPTPAPTTPAPTPAASVDLYADGTQYSRWFADGTHNDLSGKIAWSRLAGSWTSNSGPFPNTSAVSSPRTSIDYFNGIAINPLDIRDRSITVTWWLQRACATSSACATEAVGWVLWEWRQVVNSLCDPLSYAFQVSLYRNSISVARTCLLLLNAADAKITAGNQWAHYAVTIVNRGGGTIDDYSVYYNGVLVGTASSNEAPASTLWNQIQIFGFGQSQAGMGSVYDARFWYGRALDLVAIRRQMCFDGYYWEADATTNGKCTACPAGKFSNVTGAAGATECAACASGFTSASGSSSCVLITPPPTPSPTPPPTPPPTPAPTPANCGMGQYSTGPSCASCPQGKYSTTLAAMSDATCRACNPGTFADTEGSTTCLDCPAGTFALEYGRSNCTACGDGFYANRAASTSCQPCPLGSSTAPSPGMIVAT